MTSTITITQKPSKRKVKIEIDLNQWERLAAGLGLFRKEFLESLSRAEQEVSQGKIKRLRSLKHLHRS